MGYKLCPIIFLFLMGMFGILVINKDVIYNIKLVKPVGKNANSDKILSKPCLFFFLVALIPQSQLRGIW